MGKDTQKTARRTGGSGRDGSRRSGSGGRNLISREFSSGGVVFKKDKCLVTKSTPSDLFPKQVWRLPKGHVDGLESTEQAAIREVKEEAGIEAKIIKKIETIKYFYRLPIRPSSAYKHPEKRNILKFVTFFLMEYEHDLPEGHDAETSEVAWLSFDEALQTLSFSGEKQILKKAKELLESSLV